MQMSKNKLAILPEDVLKKYKKVKKERDELIIKLGKIEQYLDSIDCSYGVYGLDLMGTGKTIGKVEVKEEILKILEGGKDEES